MIKHQYKSFVILLLLLIISNQQKQDTKYNSSICTNIKIDEYHYYINANSNDRNIINTIDNMVITYNLCKQVQVHCPFTNSVVNASLIIVDSASEECIKYVQNNIEYLNTTNKSQGIRVIYNPIDQSNNSTIINNYACSDSEVIGCPTIQEGIVFLYFQKNIMIYTIVLESVGVILMVLGVYIYRGSIVLIGWGTSLMLLLFIQSFFVFLKGVPDSLINNVMLISIICSFFVGFILGYFPQAGVFCLGLWIGFVIALTLNNVAFYYLKLNPPNLILYIVMPVLGVGFGILILYIKRTFITFASSLIGSYICLRALSWHLGAFPNQFELSQKYHMGISPPVPWQFYLYVIALMILTASSSALQTKLFKRKMKKTNGATNIQEHLQRLQSGLNKQRTNFTKISKVFENERQQPKVLKKTASRQSNMINRSYSKHNQDNDQQEFDEQNMPSDSEDYESSHEKQFQRTDLQKKFINSRQKR